jgi:hypothetical protein
MTQTPLKDSIEQISKSSMVPADRKLENRVQTLESLLGFYKNRTSIVSESQGRRYRQFVVALMYAITIIKMYRRLTKQLAEALEAERDGKDHTQ